jgi:hypothetical protein
MNRIHWLKAPATMLQGSFSSIEVVVRRRGFGYPWSKPPKLRQRVKEQITLNGVRKWICPELFTVVI